MTRNAGLYDIDIGRALTTNDSISFGTEEGDYFYAWGAQLEVSEKMTDYDANEKVDPNSVRIWHPWLLVVNLLMLVVTFCALFKRRSFWFGNRVGASILGALLVVVAESIAIIPEQRFVISLMIFLWLITGLFILMLCQRQKHTF